MADLEGDGAGLPLLTGDDLALVAEYPLPDGVPDVIVNKADLALALNVSQTTVTNWQGIGLPAMSDGGNGRTYRFRLSVCYAWNQRRLGAEARERAASHEAARQLSLALLGGEQASPTGEALSLADQRKLLELEHAHAIAARDRGELIRFDEVVAGLEAAFAAMRDAMDALPDRLGRDLGLDGEQIAAAVTACDDALKGARVEIERVIGADEQQD